MAANRPRTQIFAPRKIEIERVYNHYALQNSFGFCLPSLNYINTDVTKMMLQLYC